MVCANNWVVLILQLMVFTADISWLKENDSKVEAARKLFQL